MSQSHPFRVYQRPGLSGAALVVGWSEDAGELGGEVIGWMKRKLGGEEVGEIDIEDFFPLGGVFVNKDIAQFPESKLYCCRENGLLLFRSTPPQSDWYRFLTSILDMAEECCPVTELYAIGAMVSFGAHTTPRQLMAIPGSPQIKGALSQYGLTSDMDYETPPGHRPTLNSFLLWVARERGLDGACLWVPIPFYLVAADDPEAQRVTLRFLDQRLGLGLDLSDLEEEVARLNEGIARLRVSSPQIDGYIRRLETNLALSEEENDELVNEIEGLLRRRR